MARSPSPFLATADQLFQPITSLGGILSPQLNFRFGNNIEDQEVEHAVLDRVGSYGKQLNCLFNVISVLVAHLPAEAPLTQAERDDIRIFEAMASEADAASADAQHMPRRAPTRNEVQDWIDRLGRLKKEKPDLHEQVVQQLRDALAEAGPAAVTPTKLGKAI